MSTIQDLFAEQVARTPHAEAVAHGDGSMTYAELNARANGLAHRLIDGMCRATSAATAGGNYTSILPFELYTRESI